MTTTGISQFVADLVRLYGDYGVDPSARPAYLGRFSHSSRGPLRRAWGKLFGKRKTPKPPPPRRNP